MGECTKFLIPLVFCASLISHAKISLYCFIILIFSRFCKAQADSVKDLEHTRDTKLMKRLKCSEILKKKQKINYTVLKYLEGTVSCKRAQQTKQNRFDIVFSYIHVTYGNMLYVEMKYL